MRLRIFFAALLLIGSAIPSAAQDVAYVSTTAEIPRDPYKTWSLFLVCNQNWVAPEKSADLADLYVRFQGFGDAIGKDNLAVWFWKREVPLSDPNLSRNVDVGRSAQFCRALGLVPSHGPYLVVTNAYPDLAAFPGERAVLELGNLQPGKLAQFLDKLTDELLLQGKVDAAIFAASSTPRVPSLWMRLLEGTRQTIVGLGCALKLQITTGPFSAEVRGCQGG